MAADARIGSTIAGYRIEALVGRGGMGVVYRAHDTALDRKVALKLITPDRADDPQFRERFLRESRIAASIDHANIVPIHDAGEYQGQLFIAMRYVDGTDLDALLADDGPLEPARALALVGQVASALAGPGGARRTDPTGLDGKHGPHPRHARDGPVTSTST